VIKEPLGGAHRDHEAAIATIGSSIFGALDMLDGTKPFDLRERRQEKYLRMGMV